VREREECQIVGFEEGWIRTKAAAHGIALVDQKSLEGARDTFDIVTAIEVLEHVRDPLAVLGEIRRVLKPGGVFFYTTGNAQPFRGRLLEWRYVLPEVHVSFFEPATLACALRRTGYRPEFRGFLPGFGDIIKFKLLKNLCRRRVSRWEQLLPWSLLTRLIDMRLKISAHPIGWAEGHSLSR
jgi:SAM-dependent methyltransferase